MSKNTWIGTVVCLILFICILGCDSPPWSRFIVANTSATDISVRFYTPYPTMAYPYLYSPEEWKQRVHFSSGTPKEQFKVNAEEKWIEAVVVPGAALEIDRAPYPEVQKDIASNFLIDRLDIFGSSGKVSWKGRQHIFSQFRKENDGIFSPSYGRSPIFIIDYK